MTWKYQPQESYESKVKSKRIGSKPLDGILFLCHTVIKRMFCFEQYIRLGSFVVVAFVVEIHSNGNNHAIFSHGTIIYDYLCNTLIFKCFLLKRIKIVELKDEICSLCMVLYFFNYAEWKHIVLFSCHCNANCTERQRKKNSGRKKQSELHQRKPQPYVIYTYMAYTAILWIKYLWFSLFTCCVCR